MYIYVHIYRRRMPWLLATLATRPDTAHATLTSSGVDLCRPQHRHRLVGSCVPQLVTAFCYP